MLDIFETALQWLDQDKQVALATVVKTWGSSPRQAGAKMVVAEDGEFVGSVSGGCVEGAVIDEAISVLRNNKPKLLHYGVTDELAWDVGLACGGEIDVFLEPLNNENLWQWEETKSYLEQRKSFVSIKIIKGPEEHLSRIALFCDGSVIVDDIPDAIKDDFARLSTTILKEGRSSTKELLLNDEVLECFFEFHAPLLRLIIVGGVHISRALALQAKSLGFQVYIVDPRSAFGSEERFPHVDGIISKWPDKALLELGLDRRTAVAILSHDPKLDDPALQVALPSPAFYVGALGSQRTQQKRGLRLKELGLTDGQISKLRGPIGLDLGGRKPAEIALSVIAEVVRCYYQE